ncbi:MAG: UTRA domain-containing protein [Pseudomonadota bacterium]
MTDTAPLYERVKRHITEGILSGAFAPGARLPSENDLVAALSVSRMTVNRALRELSRDGVITRVQGLGSFVSEPSASTSLIEVHDIRETIAERGGVHSARQVQAEAIKATGSVAELLQLPDGEMVQHVLIVHSENDAPLQIERRYVRHDFAPGLLDLDFASQSVFDYLQSISPVSELEHLAEATLPDEQEKPLLKIGPTHPVLRIRRRTWVGQHVVTLGYFSYPGDRHRVTVRVRPSDLADQRPQNGERPNNGASS